MLNLLKDACVELTGISRAAGRNVGQEQPEVHRTPLFREIVRKIQKDLRTALSASPVLLDTSDIKSIQTGVIIVCKIPEIRRHSPSHKIIPQQAARMLQAAGNRTGGRSY